MPRLKGPGRKRVIHIVIAEIHKVSNKLTQNKISAKTNDTVPYAVCSLQLCNHSQSLTGAPRCFYLPGKCKGAGTGYVVLDYCYPHNMWSGTLQSSGSYLASDFVEGAWRPTGPCDTGYCQGTLAFWRLPCLWM